MRWARVRRAEPASAGILAGFAARPDLSTDLVGLMLVAAIGVGAVHALGPGHGKSLIGAYLVGSGGTLRQAVAVGTAISVMHTASILGLGVLVLSAERLFAPERVYPWLGLASGLVALGLGAALLISRIHALRAAARPRFIRIRSARSPPEGWSRSRSREGSCRLRARSWSCWGRSRSAERRWGSSWSRRSASGSRLRSSRSARSRSGSGTWRRAGSPRA